MLNTTNSQVKPRVVLALLATAQLIISVDYNIVYVALPEIGKDLGFSDHSLQWVVSAYAVAFGGFLLLGGRACDVFGAKRIFILGLGLYGVASMVGGLATSPELLVGARAAQGVGGAMLFPATLTLVSVSFAAGRDRNRAFAIWGTAGGSGMILGSLLGGVLTQTMGWSAVFFVIVPIATVVAALAHVVIPRPLVESGARRFKLVASTTATIGISAVVLAVVDGPESGWSGLVGASVALGTALLGAFVVVERRSADPLIPMRLLRDRNLSVGSLVTFGYMASFGTLLYFLTLFFQRVQGFSALETGLAFLIPMVAIVVGAQTAGRAATRFSTKAALMASLVVGGLGTAILAMSLSVSGSYVSLVPGLVVLGLGQGAGYTIMFSAATQDLPASDQGIGSGLVSTTQQIGGAIGLAVLVAVGGSSASASSASVVSDIQAALWVAVAMIAGTALLALAFRRAAEAAQPIDARKVLATS